MADIDYDAETAAVAGGLSRFARRHAGGVARRAQHRGVLQQHRRSRDRAKAQKTSDGQETTQQPGRNRLVPRKLCFWNVKMLAIAAVKRRGCSRSIYSAIVAPRPHLRRRGSIRPSNLMCIA